MKNTFTSIAALALLAVVLSCSRFGGLVKTNLFEGDGAQKVAMAIKDKVGGPVNVIRVEMHSDELEVTIQSPKNPKDIDKWTYKNGSIIGPEPVQVMSIGDATMTGDKYDTTPIDDIGWVNVPTTIEKAIKLSALENAKVNLISMDGQRPETADPELKVKNEKDREAQRKACMEKTTGIGDCIRKYTMDSITGGGKFVLTWRLFVEGPRGRKDFWAKKDGTLNEKPF